MAFHITILQAIQSAAEAIRDRIPAAFGTGGGVKTDVQDRAARDLGKVDIASLDQYTPDTGRLPVLAAQGPAGSEAWLVSSQAPLGVALSTPLATVQTTIAAGVTGLSTVIDCTESKFPVRIIMPATWVAAVLTVQTSIDGVTFNDLYDEYGQEVSLTVGANRSIRLLPSEWAGVRYFKLRSGTSAVPVNQTADRVLTVVVRGL